MSGTNDTRLTTYALLCARLRLPVAVAGVAVIGVDLALPEIGAGPFGVALLVIGLALYFRLGTPRTAPVAARPPVEGRWKVMNSPGTRVPSHGVHAWGQTYAVDLVFAPVPADGTSPASRPSGSRPDVFPGFGKAVLAMGDGTVVEVHDSTPDHRSRSGAAGLLLFLAQAALRELRGPSGLLGNWITIDLDGGGYALVAHLRQGSARVRVGDHVTGGQPIAECGNTGNSTEPHVHAQLMDTRRPASAAGLPMRLTGVRGVDADGLLPGNGRQLEA